MSCATWVEMSVFITDLFSVCSTTLWVGQLDKRTTQQDVASLLEEFGPIESINVSTYSPKGAAEQDVPSHF